jgi:hypothetical protein
VAIVCADCILSAQDDYIKVLKLLKDITWFMIHYKTSDEMSDRFQKPVAGSWQAWFLHKLKLAQSTTLQRGIHFV